MIGWIVSLNLIKSSNSRHILHQFSLCSWRKKPWFSHRSSLQYPLALGKETDLRSGEVDQSRVAGWAIDVGCSRFRSVVDGWHFQSMVFFAMEKQMVNEKLNDVQWVETDIMQKDVVWRRTDLRHDRFGNATPRQQGLSLDEIEWQPVMADVRAVCPSKKGAICGEVVEWPLLAMTSDLNCDMCSLKQMEVSWGFFKVGSTNF